VLRRRRIRAGSHGKIRLRFGWGKRMSDHCQDYIQFSCRYLLYSQIASRRWFWTPCGTGASTILIRPFARRRLPAIYFR